MALLSPFALDAQPPFLIIRASIRPRLVYLTVVRVIIFLRGLPNRTSLMPTLSLFSFFLCLFFAVVHLPREPKPYRGGNIIARLIIALVLASKIGKPQSSLINPVCYTLRADSSQRDAE